MKTFCVQFLDSSGHVLETQYLNARNQFQAQDEAWRNSAAEDVHSVEVTAL